LGRITRLLCLALVFVLAGCSAPNSSESLGENVAPDDAIVQAATSALGISESKVRVTPPVTNDSYSDWDIQIILDSAPATETIDRAAAGILGALAATDTSDRPVSLSFFSEDLALNPEMFSWGQLNYYWGDPDSGSRRTRGDEVHLFHGEAINPRNVHTPSVMLTYEPRGLWQGADVEALERWAAGDLPELVQPQESPISDE